MIDATREAVSRGHLDEALATVRRHEREFPHGHLAEERDALRVIALARSGRRADAETRAAAFGGRFPTSLLAPAIERALRDVGESP